MSNKKIISWLFWLISLSVVLITACLVALCVGSANVSVKDIITNNLDQTARSVIFNIRLPRILMAIACGGALSIAGVILQGLLRNPLVEPYTLGISGGAALGVCVNLLFNLSAVIGVMSLPISGFIGALAAVVFVYWVSLRKNILNLNGMLLSGVMVSFICSSLFMLAMSFFRETNLQGIIFWMMGSLGEPDWYMVGIMTIAACAGVCVAYLFAKDLNAFSLGEEQAHHLGINIDRSKKILFILASLLTGTAVSLVGVIGFVGLVVPHFIRLFVGRDHRIVLAASFLAGAGFLVIADTIARTIIVPLELPVGVVTGLIGGIVFVWALSKKAGQQ